jgi:D-aminopeptidase
MIADAASASARPGKTGENVFRFAPPIMLDVDLCKVEQADLVALIPGIERTAARSVRFVHDDFRVIFKTFVAAFRLGATA